MKKYSLVLLLLLFGIRSLNAQTIKSPKEKQIDSLEQVIKVAKHDTIIINSLNAWKKILNPSDKEQDLKLTLKIEQLCKKNMDKKLTQMETLFYKRALANALYSMGITYYKQGKYAETLNSFEQSGLLFGALKDKLWLSNSLHNIGIVYRAQSNYPQAADYFKKGLSIREEIGDKKCIASSLTGLGNTCFLQGDYVQALSHYNRNLSIMEEVEDKNGIAGALNSLGSVYKKQSNYGQAVDHYKRSLSIREKTGDKRGIAAALSNLGAVYFNQGDYKQALANYKRSLSIEEEIGNKSGIANSLSLFGIVYAAQGDYAQALSHYKLSLSIDEETGDKVAISSWLNNLGGLCYLQGDYPQALGYYKRSLSIREDIGDKNGIAESLSNLGAVYLEQGDYTQALDHLSRSLTIRENIGDKSGFVNSLNNLGSVYKMKGNYEQALGYYKRCWNISEEIGDKQDVAMSLNNIGNSYRQQGDYSEGIKYSKKALRLALHIRDAIAIRNASRALFIQHSLLNSADSSVIYLGILKFSRDKDVTYNYFTLSEREKELYFATMESDYGLYYDFSSYHHKKYVNTPDTAYNIALMTKGLTLKSSTAMRQAVSNSGDTILIREYEQWMQLKRTISKKYGEGADTKDLENKANELERELVKKSTAFSDFDKIKNVDWKQVQAGLKKDEAAIEFVNFKSEIDTTNPIVYVALLIKPGILHPQIIKLCNEKDLEKILGAFQGNNLNYVNSVYGTKTKAQKALYEKVWQPLEEYLQGTTKVFLSPSGLLHKVSFAALSKDKNIYLCDKYQVNQQSSTGRVVLGKPFILNDNAKLLVFGGIQYSSDSTKQEIWKYLPGTLSETESITKNLKSRKINITEATGKKADELFFKTEAPKSNILHVSTHGFFFPDPEKVREEQKKNIEQNKDIAFRGAGQYGEWSFMKNKNPLMRSGLALAGANDAWNRDPLAQGEDGILTASEVSNLNLQNTQLVVLSACETGLGDIKGSEGVYGLQRAFKMAGVKYIIMSLWQVPDKETSEFMTTFYDKLIKIKDIKKAFNDTQKEMRKKYDPYFWAAFVLVE